MKIKSIELTNIKGIANKKFKLNLIPNKPNIFVAPNGFGKSSFGNGFNSLKSNKIELDDESYFDNNEENRPELKVKISNGDGLSTLIADDNQNSIKDYFDVFVINSQIISKASVQRFGGRTISRSTIEVEPTVFVSNIPKKVHFNYSISSQRRNFGSNGKVLFKIDDILASPQLHRMISSNINLDKFKQVRVNRCIEEYINEVNKFPGTEEQIKKEINNNPINKIFDCPEFKNLFDIIKSFSFPTLKADFDCIITAIQIIEVYKIMGKGQFNKACKYLYYNEYKEEITRLISDFNTTRFTIKPKEDKKKGLIINWPKVNEISNGQRDILSFVSLILKSRKSFKKDNCILIIDEIFDYLDDANLVSFQYFITNFIEEMKSLDKNLFPIVLTHLDPNYFNHFCFNRHNLKVKYLKEQDIQASQKMLNIVYNRENPLIKNFVDEYHFHFNPKHVDISDKFETLGLNKDWGDSKKFMRKIYREMQKYIDGKKKYDPIAVCFALRKVIEMKVYNNIPSPSEKEIFLDTNGTKNKLFYSQEIGIKVPEIFFLLGIIYNTSLHLYDGQDISKPLAQKLDNMTIKKLIQEVCN